MSLAESSTTDPVLTAVELLDGVDSSLWTNETPLVEAFEDSTQQSKQNNPNPAIYIWSPVDGTFDEFDAEYSRTEHNETIEIQIWHSGDSHNSGQVESNQYANDVIAILQEYARDNYDKTEWHQIKPENVSDERASKLFRETDHFILRVQVSLETLDSTGTS